MNTDADDPSERFAKDLSNRADALVRNWHGYTPAIRVCELRSISAIALEIANHEAEEIKP
jgi:hypothetical protein